MSLFQRLFGRPAQPPAATARPAAPGRASQAGASAQPSTRSGSNSAQSVRKELVRVSTRDMLLHSGIPTDWVRAEPLTTAVPGRDPGLHVRLAVLHWDPRLMVHAVALQQNLVKRVQTLDPLAEQWLMGVSWQITLKDESVCPPLPHPGSWTAAPAADQAGAPDTQPGGSADVISGPTRIGGQQSPADARKELERLLGERDADFKKRGDDGTGFEKTQPLKL